MPSENYVIPLKRVYDYKPRTRRANNAIAEIFSFLKKHTRMEKKDVIISKEVNEYIWKNSIQNPPRKIAISLKIDSGKAYVFLKDSKEFKDFGKATPEPKEKPKFKEAVQKAVKEATSQKKMTANTEKKKTDKIAKTSDKPENQKRKQVIKLKRKLQRMWSQQTEKL